ncbi:MAG: DUF92 domain-containing protein [Mucilaginibacter sp.]
MSFSFTLYELAYHSMPVYPYIPFLLLLAAGAIIPVKTGKLTPAGGLIGGILATLIFIGAGYTGFFMLTAFFVLGTVATVWKKKEKQNPLHQADGIKRNSGQVLANGGVAAIAGVLICVIPGKAELLRLMMAASLASAMADTLSSELGMVYGRKFYNIITLRKDERGLDGVISIEGTLIGIAGSAVIAAIYALSVSWNNAAVLFIIIAGTIGNLADSVLGTLFERKNYLNNDAVNFFNTLIGALAAGVLMIFF